MEKNKLEKNSNSFKNNNKKSKNKSKKSKAKNKTSSKTTYKESQEKFIDIITKIKDNPTLRIGPCEDYWNDDILGMSHYSYYFKYQSIRPCPFDREVMHGTTKRPSDGGCYRRCGVHYLNNTPEIKQRYLDRFLELQKQGHYSKKHIHEAGHLPPLLTKEEENEVEIVLERIEKEFEEKWKVESSLRSKSQNECEKNKVVIHGSNKDTLPKKLYNSIFKLIDESSSHVLFYITWGDKFVIWDDYNYVIDKECYLNNCSISLSLYYDHLNEHKAFAFAIDDYPLHCNSIEATPELEKLYYKWKDFKKLNPDKYNEPYKQTIQEQEEAYLRSVFTSECEVCMFTDHCDRVFCLKHPSEQMHSILEQELKKNTEKYVVNLHILEACNFKCRYCFAHFDYMKMLPVNIWKHIVDNVANSMHVRRFNLAGGEPLLYPDIEELIQYIKDKGFEVSIITNGFLLSEEFIKKNKNRLDCIGISVDSFDEDTLINLECKTSKNEVLDKDRFLRLCKLINKCNIDLKVNTVVSKLNWEQNLSDTLKQIKIDRWKILKMKIFKNEKFDNSDLDITEEQFNAFVERHKGVVPETVVEDSLKNSYIMIDSEGCLVDNTEDNYEKLINVADEDFMEGFKKLSFDKDLYFSRYTKE